jgi:hypothetical protein
MGTSPALSRPKFVLGKRISLKNNPEYNETWVEGLIKQHPSLLGLSDKVEYLSSQITNSNGGRLDLILKDDETIYSVELMLGALDETHIVRCLDYWLRNQTRPQFQENEHIPVLVAEHVLSSRFAEVAKMLSSRTNLIVIELAAIQVQEYLTIQCTTIFDEAPSIEDDVSPRPGGSFKDLPSELRTIAEDVLELVRPVVNGPAQLNPRNDDRIGIRVGNRVSNFIIFAPKNKFLRVDAKVSDPEAWATKLQAAGIRAWVGYGSRVRFRLTPEVFNEHRQLIGEVCVESARAWFE